jgi:PKHD-type hydroxylase
MSMWAFKLDEVNQWAHIEKAFTPEECKTLIDIALKKPKLEASIRNDGNRTQSIDPTIRKNNVVWLSPQDKDMENYYRKLTDIVMELNHQFFKFDLYGFTEMMQFTEYNQPGDNYKQHIDKIFMSIIRKLSIVVQLTDPSEYDGCNLELYSSYVPEIMTRSQGSIIAFPSYALHQVTPIIKGTRHSLVAWIGGPNFK